MTKHSIAFLVVCALAGTAHAQVPTVRTLDAFPIAFERNAGQTDQQARFIARGSGYTLLLTDDGTILRMHGQRDIRVTLTGARTSATPAGEAALPGTVNYFIGRDPSQWHTDIPTYARARYAHVYAGIDLVYYGAQGRLEYDFIIAPGSDPGAIRMRFDGVDQMAIDSAGDLALRVGDETLTIEKPRLYQQVGDERRPVAGRFRTSLGNEMSFEVGEYDRALPLIIDPVLVYSTFLGSPFTVTSIGVESTGATYIAGSVQTLFATTNQFDVLVAKVNASGSALLFQTYFGGTDNDFAESLAVDAAGGIYVAGRTLSFNLPTVAAAQTTYRDFGDAFIAKLTPQGNALTYSTYAGGTDADAGNAVAVDADGNAYMVGTTSSVNFPVLSAAQPVRAGADDVFVAKYGPAGTLIFSTYLGGLGIDEGRSAVIGANGSLVVAGVTSSSNFPTTPGALQTHYAGSTDGFVTRLSTQDGSFQYSTFLGGSGRDEIHALAVDASGAAYVVGETSSLNFPVTPGVVQLSNQGGISDAFVAKLSPEGASLIYSTYLGGPGFSGGSGSDIATGIAVAPSGQVVVTGAPGSTSFPLTAPLQPSPGTTVSDESFITKLNANATAFVYSTYWTGSIGAVAIDSSGDVYVAGGAYGPGYPTTVGAFLRELPGASLTRAFLTKISDATPPCSYRVRPDAVVGGSLVYTSDQLFTVVAPSGCAWTATPDAAWIEVTPGSGVGVGVVQYKLASNSGPTRSGTITVGDQVITVNQPSLSCTYQSTVAPTQPSGGGSVIVTMTTAIGCPWVITSLAPWATASPAAGVGSAAITFTFQANPDISPRTAYIAFGLTYSGQAMYAINQQGTCDVTVSSASINVPRAGGVGLITVSATPSNCVWTAQTDAPLWLAPSASGGAGSATLGFTAGPNTSESFRLGHFVVAGQTVTVSQAGPLGTNVPQALPPSPAAGSGSTQTFTFTFYDSNGASNLDVVNVLVNNFLDGRFGCYLAYARSINVLYLVNDPGDALLPGIVLNGGPQSVGNNQCLINGSGSSAVVSHNTLILTLTITFAPGFAGNKVIYEAGRDLNGNNSGWVQQGVWHVPGGAPGSPAAISMNPGRGGGKAPFPFQFTFRDADGYTDLVSTTVLLNSYLDGGGACYLGYHVPSNAVLLLNDPGNAYLPWLVLGSTGTVENSQCRIYSQGSGAAGSGTDLTLTLVIEFKAGFAGERVFYVSAQNDVATSGWQALGSWTVP